MTERGFRFWAARLLAPVAFFAAATLLVLLVRESFDDDGGRLTVTQVVTNELGEEVKITTVLGDPETETEADTSTSGPSLGEAETDAEPAPRPRRYTIKRGDTLEGIADTFGITVEQLIEANADENLDAVALQAGQKIRIPREDETETATETG